MPGFFSFLNRIQSEAGLLFSKNSPYPIDCESQYTNNYIPVNPDNQHPGPKVVLYAQTLCFSQDFQCMVKLFDDMANKKESYVFMPGEQRCLSDEACAELGFNPQYINCIEWDTEAANVNGIKWGIKNTSALALLSTIEDYLLTQDPSTTIFIAGPIEDIPTMDFPVENCKYAKEKSTQSTCENQAGVVKFLKETASIISTFFQKSRGGESTMERGPLDNCKSITMQ